MTASNASEEEISALAHKIWESEGRPEGRDREHWFRALALASGVDDPEAATNADPGESGVGEDPAHVRPAGRKTMDMPPESWTRTDEESDESFPASDPPGNY